MNQTQQIIEAINFEVLDKAQIIIENLDTKHTELFNIMQQFGSGDVMVQGFHSGDIFTLYVNNIVSAKYVNDPVILQVSIGNSFSRGL